MFTESTEPVVAPRGGYAKDAVEVESYVRGFGRRRADVAVSVLRFANFMGPEVDSPLTRLFTMPIVPTPLGHDPRLQFVHVDDGLEVLRRAVVGDHQGIFNVAGDGVLLLSQAARRAGRPTVAVPARTLNGVGGVLRRAGVLNLSDELVEFLTHGRAVDISRLWERFGFRPAYSTALAFEEFLDARGRGPLTAERLAFAAEHALDAVRVVTQVLPRPRRPDLAAIGESVDE